MRVATWNLLHGQQVPPTSANPLSALSADESNVHLHEIANYLLAHNLDLIGFQEIDDSQKRSGAHSQIAKIAEHMQAIDGRKKFHCAYARTVIGTPGFSWRELRTDEEVINPDDGEASYGIGLISAVPVKNWNSLNLGKSWIGLPLAVPGGKDGKSLRFLYVRDEPRLALAAELEDGTIVAVMHLSFVPLVNLWQLFRVKRWLKKLGRNCDQVILMGDLNLPFNIPVRPKFLTEWISLNNQKSYPSWKPTVKFDYILSLRKRERKSVAAVEVNLPPSGFSDHLPLAVDFN